MPLPFELLLALLGYAFVSSITPGPNNLMLLASGVNFGLKRTLPHMAGISIGHAFMVFLVGIGLAGLFTSYPPARHVLKAASTAYLLWLAWKIARAAPPDPSAETRTQPFTFWQAAAFQWVNPKAWSMALTANTLYAPDASFIAAGTVALGFAVVNFPCVSTWAALGTLLRSKLDAPHVLQRFNWLMAALLITTLIPVLRG